MSDIQNEVAWAALKQDVIAEKRELSKRYGKRRYPRNEYEVLKVFIEDELSKENEEDINWNEIDNIELELRGAENIPRKIFQEEAYQETLRLLDSIYNSESEEEDEPIEEIDFFDDSISDDPIGELELLDSLSFGTTENEDGDTTEVTLVDIKKTIRNKFGKWKKNFTSMI